ncbi:MAG: DNA/RNA nuclease SfsA [Oscillatoriales cyanobacterium SM2_2_1]|nr:DNA/RNA nuclease SfsA [Oscillatoriales cyanobacterium SM2_2_1]
MQVYSYPLLQRGTLVRRYQRFFAEVDLVTGDRITAHCPNTGPMSGICILGSPVYVSFHDDPKRKLQWTWEMIQVQDTWVGVNTGLPNRVIGKMLAAGFIPELGPIARIAQEVPYGVERSRIDFVVTDPEGQPTYVEVKNTTWSQGDRAMFPDTVTTRGQKHVRELMALQSQGTATALIFFINRSDCTTFAAGSAADPEYGRLLSQAIALGVKVLPCRFAVTPTEIHYLGLATLHDG